jgi:hypothetical protein
MWVFYNLFQPVMRLKEKTYLSNGDGTHRLQRRFDTAQTVGCQANHPLKGTLCQVIHPPLCQVIHPG